MVTVLDELELTSLVTSIHGVSAVIVQPSGSGGSAASSAAGVIPLPRSCRAG
jgi:hypothetical protein